MKILINLTINLIKHYKMNETYFNTLPEELIFIIGYKFDNTDDILSLSEVDGTLSNILSKPNFWKYKLNNDKLDTIVNIDNFSNKVNIIEWVMWYDTTKRANQEGEEIVKALEDCDKYVSYYGNEYICDNILSVDVINLPNINLFDIPEIDYAILVKFYRKIMSKKYEHLGFDEGFESEMPIEMILKDVYIRSITPCIDLIYDDDNKVFYIDIYNLLDTCNRYTEEDTIPGDYPTTYSINRTNFVRLLKKLSYYNIPILDISSHRKDKEGQIQRSALYGAKSK